MEDSKRFSLKHILSFSGLNYIQAGISFLTSIILARQLGAEVFGYFAYGLIFANTLSVIMQFGTDKTLVRDLIQDGHPEKTLASVSLIWSFIGVIGVIGIVIWDFFISEINQIAAWVVLLCTLSGFFQGMTVSAWFDFKRKMNLQALYAVIGRAIYLLGILITVFFINENAAVVWAACFLFLSRVISFSLEWKFVLQSTTLYFKKTFDVVEKIIKNNSWVFFAAIGNLLMTQVNQIILKDKGGATALAYYGVSFQIIMMVRLLQQQILRIVAPSIAGITHIDKLIPAKAFKSLTQYSLVSFLASLFILIPLYFFTPWIVQKFLGEEYLPAIPVMNILFLWSAIFGVALVNNQFLIGLRREKSFCITTLIFGLISLVLAFLFTEKYGAKGAAMSLLLAHMGSIFTQFIIVITAIKKNYKNRCDEEKELNRKNQNRL